MQNAVRVLILLFLVLTANGQDKAELNEETYARIRDSILMDSTESAWNEIPWQPDLGEAIREAKKLEKPILLWMMNGHPCGMT